MLSKHSIMVRAILTERCKLPLMTALIVTLMQEGSGFTLSPMRLLHLARRNIHRVSHSWDSRCTALSVPSTCLVVAEAMVSSHRPPCFQDADRLKVQHNVGPSKFIEPDRRQKGSLVAMKALVHAMVMKGKVSYTFPCAASWFTGRLNVCRRIILRRLDTLAC